MKNKPKDNDFFVTVDGVGTFRFNRKTYGAQIKIDAAAARILGANGIDAMEDPVMRTHADLVGCYTGLMVECPLGWEFIEAVDLTERPELDKTIFDLYVGLKEKLNSFRLTRGDEAAGAGSEEKGVAASQDHAVLGAEPLPGIAN
jgi:hypothetical protein